MLLTGSNKDHGKIKQGEGIGNDQSCVYVAPVDGFSKEGL